jgi:hypothetical protein
MPGKNRGQGLKFPHGFHFWLIWLFYGVRRNVDGDTPASPWDLPEYALLIFHCRLDVERKNPTPLVGP